MEGQLFEKLSDSRAKCLLCPHNCLLLPGQHGICRVRINRGGEIYSETFEKYSSVSVDPIEKKPLYHFYPGSNILSVGAIGCNMRCSWCQNCEISQVGLMSFPGLQTFSAEQLVEQAINHADNIGIAFTYNEPGINIESNLQVAALAKEKDLKNVLVTNGYLNPEPFSDFVNLFDAFNIDIKSFDEKNHIRYTSVNRNVILKNAQAVLRQNKHLELTYLVVPGVNDNIEEFKTFIHWMSNELSDKVPLHLSRYFPRYRYTEAATSGDKLLQFADYASTYLPFVYLGNVATSKYRSTICPGCNSMIVNRNGFNSAVVGCSKGFCEKCGKKILISV